jgi:hypothetical protein
MDKPVVQKDETATFLRRTGHIYNLQKIFELIRLMWYLRISNLGFYTVPTIIR